MKRREFITLLGGAAATWSLAAPAQQSERPRIGVLVTSDPEPFWSLFREGLRASGYIEGRNIQFEFRSANRKPDLLGLLADELVRRKVNIIVASLTPAVIAARQATSEIPIVMVPAGDPVRTGLISSLARPGGNHRIILYDRRTLRKNPRAHPRGAAVHAARGRARQRSH